MPFAAKPDEQSPTNPSSQSSTTSISDFLHLPGIEYYPDFLTVPQQTLLLHHLKTKTTPKSWKTLKNRRLQNYGGLPHPKGMIPIPLPSFLQLVINQLVECGIFEEEQRPNHVLVNHYKPGQGIDMHTDGPVFASNAAIVSLGSDTVMKFWKERDDGKRDWIGGVKLEKGSMLVLKEDAYENTLHGIEEKSVDEGDKLIWGLGEGEVLERGERFSLTIRRCKKTLKSRIQLGHR